MNSCEEDRQAAESVRILELFSGIGGWKYAADQTFQDIEYTCAYDIAPAANEVYRHNFGVDPCKISIEKLNTKKLAELNCNVWLLSPPCQPFTRSNTTESRDDADPRARPLLHLAKLLMNLGEKPAQFERQQNPTHTKKVQAYRPHWIALENVVGFEESNCCRHWLQALEDCGYHYLQFVLTPTQFGIPNERPRYYCLASLSPFVEQNASPAIPNHQCILSSLPHDDHMAPTSIESIGKFLDFPSCTFGHLGKAKSKGQDADNGVVGNKETHSAKSSSLNHSFLVPDETLKKSSGWCFDIVTSRSQRSACFTKSYSRYIKGTGSVLYLDECCGFENGGCGDVGTTSEPLTAAETGHRSNATVKMKGQKESAKTEGSTSYSEHRQHHCCQHCGSIRSSQKKSITGKRKQRASSSRNINISPGSGNDEGDCPHNSHPISEKRKVGEEKENSTEDGEEREVYNHHEDEFLQLPEERSYEDGWQEKFYKKLRYFTPTEIARLLSFPVPAAGAEVGGGGGGGGPPARPQGGGGGAPAGGARGGGASFSFPAALGRRQRYALLGNSLSVAVAARLLRFLAARTAGPGPPRARRGGAQRRALIPRLTRGGGGGRAAVVGCVREEGRAAAARRRAAPSGRLCRGSFRSWRPPSVVWG